MHEVDLHLHTTHSDGNLTPTELVDLCARKGLKVIAVSDHDSTEGIDEALAAAKPRGIEVIPAIELSADVPNNEIHMLGYFVDITDHEFQDTLAKFRDGRKDRAREMVDRLNDLDIHITWEQVQRIADGAAVGRPHIAQAMVERGYVQYNKDAFDRYLGRNGLAYIQRPRLKPEEAVQMLLRNGALPAMAHPLYYERTNIPALEKTIADLKEAGMVGLEVHYGEFSNDEIEMLKSIAQKFDLVPCGGSDYHASGNPGEIHPGDAGPPMSSVDALRKRLTPTPMP